MADITIEKTHDLLEKLAEYVMNEVPTRREMNELPTKHEMYEALEKKADKKDVEKIKQGINTLLNGMDAQAKQLDIIRTEQVTTNAALQRHEKRITSLEEKQTGYRIRDAEE